MAKRVLILFAHPALQRSRVNRHLIEAIEDLDGVTIRDLYECYPDLMIEVEREQTYLTEHDVYVFQHPLYWYSTPALLKEWQDLVLTHGWAFGSEGNALKGKIALQAVTTGGSVEAYQTSGAKGHVVRDFLLPFEESCKLCKMTYLAPFVVHGTHRINSKADMEESCAAYRQLIEALRDDRVNLAAAAKGDDLQSRMSEVIPA